MVLITTRDGRTPQYGSASGGGGDAPPRPEGAEAMAEVRRAFLEGMAPDGGLYLPARIPRLAMEELQDLKTLGFREIALRVAPRLLEDFLPAGEVEEVVDGALDFPVPLRRLDPSTFVLELFHGPTGSFKDVGARFLARLLERTRSDAGERVVVLVATSGDTGGAVARAVHGIPGVDAVVLYPEGRLSPLQLRHISGSAGGVGEGDVWPVAVRGSFDDCQRMVKEVLVEGGARPGLTLTSANSVNLGRLLPQVLYYVSAWTHMAEYLEEEGGVEEADGPRPWVSVPSGNLGNLTAAVLASRMGVPFRGLVAATNANAALKTYLDRGELPEGGARKTHSSAMDVVGPSNLERLLVLAGGREALAREVVATSHDDQATLEAMGHLHRRHGYLVDPHTAVGWKGLEEVRERERRQGRDPGPGIVVATADPAKFPEVVRMGTGEDPPVRPAWRRDAERGAMEPRARLEPDPEALRALLADL